MHKYLFLSRGGERSATKTTKDTRIGLAPGVRGKTANLKPEISNKGPEGKTQISKPNPKQARNVGPFLI
jgi:hypothetical protein